LVFYEDSAGTKYISDYVISHNALEYSTDGQCGVGSITLGLCVPLSVVLILANYITLTLYKSLNRYIAFVPE